MKDLENIFKTSYDFLILDDGKWCYMADKKIPLFSKLVANFDFDIDFEQ